MREALDGGIGIAAIEFCQHGEKRGALKECANSGTIVSALDRIVPPRWPGMSRSSISAKRSWLSLSVQ
jgi:hypothetical protein